MCLRTVSRTGATCKNGVENKVVRKVMVWLTSEIGLMDAKARKVVLRKRWLVQGRELGSELLGDCSIGLLEQAILAASFRKVLLMLGWECK
ncbi:hypothetical protein ACH5RR_008690 [Cinchona calisaya]|uniref:Uncharacterized protein n=1 Tax=Cinchona calisaya TaxID=153742 RepID=A0ABD3AHL5_9GENT